MRYLFIIIIFFSSFISFSQQDTRGGNVQDRISNKENMRTLLDDSTKVIYGMKTTSYLLKDDYLDGDTIFLTLDSSLHNIEKTSIFEKNNMRYQNLGNIGTPLFDMFNFNPNSFSISSGFISLNPYFKESSLIKFYDTKSPFIDLELFFGGNGRSKVDFLFSRNINKNWNIGFDIHRISADKQIGASKTKGDKNINSSLFKFNVFHISKNRKFSFYSNIISFNHQILGTGGVNILVDSLPLDFYLYNDFEIRLKNIENIEKRKKINSYIDYKIIDGLKLYNDLTYETQNLYYNDLNISENFDYYENFINSNLLTSDSFKLKSFSNRFGIRGSIRKIKYNVFANYKLLNYTYTNNEKIAINEFYVGGKLKYDNNKFKVLGEVNLKTSGDYRFNGLLKNNIFTFSYSSGLYEPSIFQNHYSGNHFFWKNDFNLTFVNQLKANFKIDRKNIYFSPSISIITIDDYIYLSEEKIPLQNPSLLSINQIGINFNISLFDGLINLDNEYLHSIYSESVKKILNTPKNHLYSKLYYKNKWFKNSVPVQFGVNIYYRSKYFGNAYEPILQSYFVQNSFELENNLRYNLFFSMQVNNLRLFLKMTHFNQFDRYNGYFVTPFYPAQKKVLDLGLKWYFFN